MKNRKKKYNKWIDNLRRHYRYSVLDEGSLEEKVHIRATRLGFSILITITLLLFAAFVAAICFYTPFKRLGPDYTNVNLRESLIQETLRVDSLQHVTNLQRNQLNTIKAAIAGEIRIDSFATPSEFKMYAQDFIPKSETEEQYRNDYEERERYNLSSISDKRVEDAPVFFRPTRGIIKRPFSQKEQHLGCDITAAPNEPTLSTFEGNIILIEYTATEEWIVTIMHKNGFISIYKNLSQCFKRAGNYVKTGEVLGIAALPDDGGKSYIHFELWKNGEPLNPADYVNF